MKKIIFLIIFAVAMTSTSITVYANSRPWIVNIDQISQLSKYIENLNNTKKVLSNTSMAGGKTPALNTSAATAPVVSKTPLPKPKPVVPKQARILGKTNGLPVLTLDYADKPLWTVLRDISDRTGYVFNIRKINLTKKETVKGKYNLAVILSKLFPTDKTTINLSQKKVKICR